MIHKYTAFTKPSEVEQVDCAAYYEASKRVNWIGSFILAVSIEAISVNEFIRILNEILQATDTGNRLGAYLLNAVQSYRVEQVMESNQFSPNVPGRTKPFQISLHFFKKKVRFPSFSTQFHFDEAGNLKEIEYIEGGIWLSVSPRLKRVSLPMIAITPWRKPIPHNGGIL